MTTAKDVSADKLIAKVKEELKKIKEIEPLAWSRFAKTGPHRERPPEQQDFWYIRTASLLRRIYLNGTVGVSKLRTYYGGRKRRGHKPAKSKKAGGSVIRKILQQLEKVGFIEKVKGGRKITSKGRKFLDRAAYEAKRA